MHVRKSRIPHKLQDFLVMKHCYFMHDAFDARADSWDSVRISSKTCAGDIHIVLKKPCKFEGCAFRRQHRIISLSCCSQLFRLATAGCGRPLRATLLLAPSCAEAQSLQH